MFSFTCDYEEGAHPRILDALRAVNPVQSRGYGEDVYTSQAADAIRARLGDTDCAVHFIPGGTQTNLIAISAFLRPYEAVISADSGHVNVHETGAIEATGHKVIAVPARDGKLRPADIESVVAFHTDEHMVMPRLVYISNATELGTVYTRQELEGLRDVCSRHDLLLFVDGARLGTALCAQGGDVALADLAAFADAFYIGGTKNGALLGEALVICRKEFDHNFRYHIKQKGGLLAKGRILGVQFLELFKDDLFFRLAQHANDMAALLQTGLEQTGCAFLSRSNTNQLFPILPNTQIEKLAESYQFIVWSRVDAQHSCIRLVTSWATPQTEVEQFVTKLRQIRSN